jgi:hypothetical protein
MTLEELAKAGRERVSDLIAFLSEHGGISELPSGDKHDQDDDDVNWLQGETEWVKKIQSGAGDILSFLRVYQRNLYGMISASSPDLL